MYDCIAIIHALESSFQCHICFHDYEGRIGRSIGKVPLYHRNQTCDKVRRSRRCFQYCCGMEAQDSRNKMISCRRPFFKCCHAGLYELAVPVFYGSQLTGIMFAGPFARVDIPDDGGKLLIQELRSDATGLTSDSISTLPSLSCEQGHDLIVFSALTAEKISLATGSNQSPPSHAPYEIRIQYYLDRHFREKLRLGDLADYLGVSKIRLCQLMRKHFDMTFTEVLTKRRIEHARYLLQNSGMKIAAIADDCGYSDPEYFHRIYKSHTGDTPAAYRQSHKNKNSTSGLLT